MGFWEGGLGETLLTPTAFAAWLRPKPLSEVYDCTNDVG